MKAKHLFQMLLVGMTLLTVSSCKVVQGITEVASAILDTALPTTSTVSAQAGNENYQVSVAQCYAKGNDVYVVFNIQNRMREDGIDVRIRKAVGDNWYTAFDNAGNRYNYEFISDNVSNESAVGGIPAGMSIKITAKISNYATNAKSVGIIRFYLWDYNKGNSRIKQDIIFRNIPITRNAVSTTTTSTTQPATSTTTPTNTTTSTITTTNTATTATTTTQNNAAATTVINGLTKPQNAVKRPAATVKVKYGVGELGMFDLRGPVKKCVQKDPQQSVTYTFDKKGKWLTKDGKTPKQIYGNTIKRDKAGRIIQTSSNEFTYDHYTYNSKGLLTEASWYSGEDVEQYEYDADGFLVKQIYIIAPDMGSDEEPERIERTFTVTKIDKYGNWLERTDNKGVKETRTLTYHDGTTSAAASNLPSTTTTTTATTTATTEVGKGDLPVFDLRGPVKSVKMKIAFNDTDSPSQYTFDTNGKVTAVNGESGSLHDWVGDMWGFTIKNNRMTKMEMVSPMGGWTEEWTMTFNKNGDVTKIKEVYNGRFGKSTTTSTVTIVSRDSHGNWTKRKVTTEGKTETETRTITYY